MTSASNRVGVEIELGKLEIDRVVEVAASVLGGDVEQQSPYDQRIETRWGEARVELDSRPLKQLSKAWGSEPGRLAEMTSDALEKLVSEVVPCELVLPPMPRAELPVLDELCDALGRAGASGTYDRLRFAFGVHFNPELSDPDAETLRRHIQAFALLYPDLLEKLEVDPSRRITPFIDPYPDEYVAHVLADGYAPDLPTLIDDYLRFNPTRNRALDMLPMFTELDEERVRAVVDDSAVQARPTFHYRLCNSRVGEDGWTLSSEWQSWLAIEELARDTATLDATRRGWRTRRDAEPDGWERLEGALGLA